MIEIETIWHRMGHDHPMIEDLAILVGQAWAIAAALQLVLWAIQQRTRNAGIVDVGWAFSFALVVVFFVVRARAPITAWAPIAVIVGAWSLRLSGYLVSRGAARAPEEGRYVDLRQRWAPHASVRFFIFFQAQAALTGLLSTAFVVPFVTMPWDSGWLRALGAAISVIGVIGESVADQQLAHWKRNPVHHGAVCDVGLWAYSRHPNYFFEWCVWLGHAVYGLAFIAHGGWISVGGQALILASILKVTGIPATEAQALRSKGDLYRRYQQTTSAFLPLPRRRS